MAHDNQIKLSRDTELRKVAMGTLSMIAAILEINNDWKKVMSLVPRNPRSEHFEPKYTKEHIRQIEDHARITNRKCADILFEEWGTSGRIRPTLGTLKEVVEKAEIYRAAEMLASMLQEPNPERPKDGPAALIDTNVTLLMQQTTGSYNGTTHQASGAPKPYPSLGNRTTSLVQPNTSELPDFSAMLTPGDQQDHHSFQNSFAHIDFEALGIDKGILTDENLVYFPYADLEMITNNFSSKLIPTFNERCEYKLAGRVGSGGFGEVFVGHHPKYGHIAVKRNRDDHKRKHDFIPGKIFCAELNYAQFKHENILSILGFSIDYSKDRLSLCIVSEYIERGTLDQIIHEKILSEDQRIDIMVGTAEGIKYLHNVKIDAEGIQKMLHGDIKSDNILLTRDLVPKLCDFGLTKTFDKSRLTKLIMGTSAYMAPEAIKGTVTQKNDIYSYGVVLLELLTGQKAIVKKPNNELSHIMNLIEEKGLSSSLDFVVRSWTKHNEIYDLAKHCLETDAKKRPSAGEICLSLYKIKDGLKK